MSLIGPLVGLRVHIVDAIFVINFYSPVEVYIEQIDFGGTFRLIGRVNLPVQDIGRISFDVSTKCCTQYGHDSGF